MEKGDYAKVSVNHEVVRLLGGERSEADGGGCVDYETEEGFDDCMYEALRSVIVKEVGCTVPWLPPKEDDQVCDKEEDRKRAFAVYQKNRRNQV